MIDFVLAQFSVRGRTSRHTFLRRWLKLVCLSALNIVGAVFLTSQGFKFAGYAAIAIEVVLILFNLAMIVRRFHDRGHSGWWLVPFLGSPIGTYFAEQFERTRPEVFLILISAFLILNTWLLIELFFRRGTRGTNRFGEDPSAVPL